jgi:hypothetical protein
MSDPRNNPPHTASSWPVLLLALAAFVAIWSGWVGLGTLTGFGVVQPLPGIWDGLRIDTRVTLPIGMEAYAAYALSVGLGQTATARAQTFARRSAFGALILGAAGQVAYHLMSAAGLTRAPWPVTALVACLPVAVLGMGAALAHFTHASAPATATAMPEPVTSTLATIPAGGRGQVEVSPAGAGPSARPDLVQPMAAYAVMGDRPDWGADTGVRVRELHTEHPDWTRARIGEVAGCSARTVRRHLHTTEVTKSTQEREAS